VIARTFATAYAGSEAKERYGEAVPFNDVVSLGFDSDDAHVAHGLVKIILVQFLQQPAGRNGPWYQLPHTCIKTGTHLLTSINTGNRPLDLVHIFLYCDSIDTGHTWVLILVPVLIQ